MSKKGIARMTNNKINSFNILIKDVFNSNTFFNLQIILLYYS